MKALSTSEEQVMAALWACGKPATRRQIAAKLPPDCVWADSTLLNFLLRLEAKGYVRPEKQGNKNIYTPLVRRVTYCGAVSAANSVWRGPAQHGGGVIGYRTHHQC